MNPKVHSSVSAHFGQMSALVAHSGIQRPHGVDGVDTPDTSDLLKLDSNFSLVNSITLKCFLFASELFSGTRTLSKQAGNQSCLIGFLGASF